MVFGWLGWYHVSTSRWLVAGWAAGWCAYCDESAARVARGICRPSRRRPPLVLPAAGPLLFRLLALHEVREDADESARLLRDDANGQHLVDQGTLANSEGCDGDQPVHQVLVAV